jgi:hypothetical protein
MIERMLEWRLLSNADYTAIDSEGKNLACIHQRLPEWGEARGFEITRLESGPVLQRAGQRVRVILETISIEDFLAQQNGRQSWDLLVAHAFLDLVDIPTVLSGLFPLLSEAGLFYFSLNFDGLTILEPVLDHELDTLILTLYHRSMDERLVAGKQTGDSLTGRHLFLRILQAGGMISAAGASDWVVFPRSGGYTADESYFLHYILHTINQQLSGHPDLAQERFRAWIAERHAQVERGELIYLAHQLDILGKVAWKC